MASLSPGQQSLLGRASTARLQDAFERLNPYLKNGRWLGKENRYRTQVDAVLDKDKGNSINDRQLAEYIAASGPLHCADGWSYVGRSLACHAQGDTDAARHLAYYGE